jgi:DNA-binding MarR family transcriptional regulator
MNAKSITAKRARGARAAAMRNVDFEKIDLGHLSGLVGYAVRRAQLTIFRDFLRSFSKVNIRPIQYGVLTVIEQNPGLKQSQVCSAIGIKRANFVALLNELERRGLAKRDRTPSDQRANALYLTKKGKAFMRELRKINKTHESRMTAHLRNDERLHLVRLLNRITLAPRTDH